jgi:hypothetical protein
LDSKILCEAGLGTWKYCGVLGKSRITRGTEGAPDSMMMERMGDAVMATSSEISNCLRLVREYVLERAVYSQKRLA